MYMLCIILKSKTFRFYILLTLEPWIVPGAFTWSECRHGSLPARRKSSPCDGQLQVSSGLGWDARYLVKHYSVKCFCEGVFGMRLTFKLVDFQ